MSADLAHIVAQETQDGRRIVQFLLSAMDGQLPDFQPCHRLAAARLLVKLGFPPEQPAPPTRPRSVRATPSPHSPTESPSGDSDHRIHSELAQVVRDATDQGRAAVRFLVSVMQGELPDFKPGHRLDAAKELLRRGFDHAPAAEPDPYQPDPYQDVQAEPDPAEVEAQRQLQENIEFSRHGPVYYEIYPYPCVCEDRLHDCNGNVLTPEQREKVARRAPARTLFIDIDDTMDAFIARYADYLTRRNALNPDNPIDFNLIRWPRYPPGPDP